MENSNNNKTSEQKNEDTESQQARAYLREKFLRFIAKISNGQTSEINMFENITVKAKLRAFDLDFQNIAVEDLQTPVLPAEKAILRSSDIISIHLKNIPVESLTN